MGLLARPLCWMLLAARDGLRVQLDVLHVRVDGSSSAEFLNGTPAIISSWGRHVWSLHSHGRHDASNEVLDSMGVAYLLFAQPRRAI